MNIYPAFATCPAGKARCHGMGRQEQNMSGITPPFYEAGGGLYRYPGLARGVSMMTNALTGGLGTGKTTVLAMFKKLDVLTLSADDLVHEELKKNKGLQKRIKDAFGLEVFQKGKIQRQLLARKVFGRPKDLNKLNTMIHPLVRRRLFQLFRRYQNKPLMVVEIPLLFETGFDKFFDLTIGVATDLKIQRERLLKDSRFDLESIALRMRRQLPLDKKIARCDFIIDNSGNRRRTFHQVKKLIELICADNLCSLSFHKLCAH